MNSDRAGDMTSGIHQENVSDLNEVLSSHRDRLRRMVELRMDRRLRGRVDASDVIQEAFIEAAQRYPEYQQQASVPPFIWLRFLTGQKLLQFHRRHLGVQARNTDREISLIHRSAPGATSYELAAQLIGKQTSPTQAVMKAELKLQLESVINAMDEIDREVLALRHFEQLSNQETAEILQISEQASYKRYVRALKRLKQVMPPQP